HPQTKNTKDSALVEQIHCKKLEENKIKSNHSFNKPNDEDTLNQLEKLPEEANLTNQDLKENLKDKENIFSKNSIEKLGYLEELEKKETLTSVGQKQKFQQELIDQFINDKPKIRRNNPNLSQGQTDLSEKFTKLNSNLITENLASIFIKQGKIKKAIDIYNELIWKFPEKKAYFVGCIEKLKK
ncbi:tetratricopeptide repeat protein, partial [Xanthovirga aplysinae]|uniref:tetratricopeptide repeat protein n=1 Tax=Xanthovirga aplysinae TaxID=2529853 RepID=UPI0024834965